MYEGDYGKGEPPGQPSDHSVFGDEGCGSRTHLAAGGRRSAHVGKLTHSTGSKSRLPQWAWKQNSAPSMGTIYCIQQGILKHGSLTQGHRDRRENDAVMLESSRDFSGLSQRQVMGWSDAGGLLRVITDFMIGVNPTLRAKNQAKLIQIQHPEPSAAPLTLPVRGEDPHKKIQLRGRRKQCHFAAQALCCSIYCSAHSPFPLPRPPAVPPLQDVDRCSLCHRPAVARSPSRDGAFWLPSTSLCLPALHSRGSQQGCASMGPCTGQGSPR